MNGRETLWNKRLELEREPRLAIAYHFNGILEFFLKGLSDDLYRRYVEIPFEERIILLYVRDLSITTRDCEEAKRIENETSK